MIFNTNIIYIIKFRDSQTQESVTSGEGSMTHRSWRHQFRVNFKESTNSTSYSFEAIDSVVVRTAGEPYNVWQAIGDTYEIWVCQEENDINYSFRSLVTFNNSVGQEQKIYAHLDGKQANSSSTIIKNTPIIQTPLSVIDDLNRLSRDGSPGGDYNVNTTTTLVGRSH